MSQKRSNIKSIYTLLKLTVGTGVTSAPTIFSVYEPKYAHIIIMLFASMTFLSIYYLAYLCVEFNQKDEASDQIENLHYQRLSYTISSFIGYVVSVSIFLSSLISLIGSIQGLMNMIMGILYQLSSSMNVNSSSVIIPVLISVISSIYLIIRYLGITAIMFLSNANLIAVGMFTLTMIAYYFTNNEFSIKPFQKFDMKWHEVIGRNFSLFHCQTSFFNIYNKIADNSISNMQNICFFSSLFLSLIYLIVGYLGYIGMSPNLGNKTVLQIFLEPNSHVYQELIKRRFLRYLPLFNLIFFAMNSYSSLTFNLYYLTNKISNHHFIGLFFEKKSPRNNFILLTLLFVLFILGITNIQTNNISFLIVTLFYGPLSYVYPSILMFLYIKKYNFLKISSFFMFTGSIFLIIIVLIRRYS